MAVQADFESVCEVCIVGAGPVGTYLAARLARAGIKVVVFEALSSIADEARAISHMPILFKEFETAGILSRMKQVSDVHDGGICFRRTKDLQVMDKIQAKPGMPGPLVLPQQKFTELLIDEVKQFPDAQVLFGHKVVKVQDVGDSVQVEVQETQTDMIKRYRCKYLVGSDGSRSMVRSTLKTRYVGDTLPFKLLAADIVFPFEDYGFDSANFMLDSEDFGLIGKITETKTQESIWRVSTAFPIEMSDDDIMEAIPVKFQKLFKEMKPGSYRILKAKPYKAHQFSTTTMRNGRLLIVGDAAHLSNPYSGQSLASGIFDVSSLAQCLVSILKQNTPDTLLDEWSEDRVSKFEKVLNPLSRGCFAAVRDADTETIAQRHPFLKAMKAGPGKGGPPPSLHTDVTKFKDWNSSSNGELNDRASIDQIWSKP